MLTDSMKYTVKYEKGSEIGIVELLDISIEKCRYQYGPDIEPVFIHLDPDSYWTLLMDKQVNEERLVKLDELNAYKGIYRGIKFRVHPNYEKIEIFWH